MCIVDDKFRNRNYFFYYCSFVLTDIPKYITYCIHYIFKR